MFSVLLCFSHSFSLPAISYSRWKKFNFIKHSDKRKCALNQGVKRDDVWSLFVHILFFLFYLYLLVLLNRKYKYKYTQNVYTVHILSLCSMSFELMREHDFGGIYLSTFAYLTVAKHFFFQSIEFSLPFAVLFFSAFLILAMTHLACVLAYVSILVPSMRLSYSNTSSSIFKYFELIIFVRRKIAYITFELSHLDALQMFNR